VKDLVTLRAARPADATAMVRIQDAAVLARWPGHYEDDALRAWTLRARGKDETHFHARMAVARTLVAEHPEAGVVGFGEIDTENGELTLLFVDPDWTGRGLGARLLVALEEQALADGVSALSLFASKNAIGFYEKHGWRRGSAVEHTVGGHSIECLCMLRDLA
jgi:putative acetyltransferase